MTLPALLLLVKAPLPGLVKTRLAATLGEAVALGGGGGGVANVLAAADASDLPTTLVYAPADALEQVTALCGRQRRYQPQTGDDLGARMNAALGRAFADGAEAALLIGSDLPLLTGSLLRQAAALLTENQAVIGPADDGGYF